jgi:RecA-family ATPase
MKPSAKRRELTRDEGGAPYLAPVPEPISVPVDIEVEQAVLGAVLIDNRHLDGLGTTLRREDFYDPLHQRIYDLMLELWTAERAITPLTLKALMQNDPGLVEIGLDYLVSLAEAAPAIVNVGEMARTIQRAAHRREIVSIAEALVHDVKHGLRDGGVDALVEEAEAALARLSEMAEGGLRTVSAASLDGQPIEDDGFFAEDLIPRRTVTLFGGDGGTGKSLLAKQLAVAATVGTNWMGRILNERGAVLYLSAEDDMNVLHKRLADIVAREGLTLSDLTHLHIAPLVGEDALLARLQHDGTIAATALYRQLEARVRAIKPVLVVIDTLADFFGGEENNRTHARQFVGMLRRICIKHDTTAVLLSHPSVSGMTSGRGTSGSTGWSNSVRSRLSLERIRSKDDSEDDPDVRVLKCKKSNYGKTGGDIRLRWDRGVFVLAASTDGAKATEADAKADRVFLDMLGAYALQGRRVGASQGHGFAPAVFSKDQTSVGVKKDALLGAMNRLLARGSILIEEFGPPSRRHKYLVPAESAHQ